MSLTAPNPAKIALFLAAAAFSLTPWCQPWMSLALGMALALAGLTVFEATAKKVSRFLIQACIVMLGLRLALGELAHAAASGLVFAAATIVGTLALGALAGRVLRVDREVSTLISSGTAVCGGSAIAAVGASSGASSANMAVATGAVFILNAIALYVFPPIGHALHLSDVQFGTWAGVAIHDMSSVVNASKNFHAGSVEVPVALDTANVVKLSRVIWIAPISLLARWWMSRAGARPGAAPGASASPSAGVRQSPIPIFIVLFLAASALRTFVPRLGDYAEPIRLVASSGFQLALFLIGAGLSRKAIASVGPRALGLAVLLWAFISVAALLVVRATVT